ncbi:MAG: flippase-like domain-containing protein [Magnetococcales bacterium]|nr:flippase-like domain-containing protein [Magnetococcales bacterium]
MVKKLVSLSIGLGLVVIFFHIADFSWHDVLEHMREGGWQTLLGVIFFTFLMYLLSAIKWSIIIHGLYPEIKNISVRALYGHISISYIAGLIIPQAVSNIFIRSVGLRKHNNVAMQVGIYTVLIDQITNLLSIIIYIIPSIIIFFRIGSRETAIWLASVSTIFLVIIFSRYHRIVFQMVGHGYACLISLFHRIPYRKSAANEIKFDMNFTLSDQAAFYSIMAALIRHVVIAVRLYLIVWFMNLNIDFFILFCSSSITLLIGILTMIPGQLGVGEMGWYALLGISGSPDSDIVVFVVSMRIFSNVAIILLGLIELVAFNPSNSQPDGLTRSK